MLAAGSDGGDHKDADFQFKFLRMRTGIETIMKLETCSAVQIHHSPLKLEKMGGHGKN